MSTGLSSEMRSNYCWRTPSSGVKAKTAILESRSARPCFASIRVVLGQLRNRPTEGKARWSARWMPIRGLLGAVGQPVQQVASLRQGPPARRIHRCRLRLL